MFITGTDPHEITTIVSQLNASDSMGCDGISASIFKAILPEILTPLTALFDKSLETGVFPDKLKIAKIIPIHKTGDKSKVSNYRPISVLPFFFKNIRKTCIIDC
jgi:hypothetical protein